jgi:hypothetical protein
MIIGLDYWQVCSHWPYFRVLATALRQAGHEVHVVSAVGPKSAGSVAADLAARDIEVDGVHEVLFRHSRQSPELKLAKCRELGITVFYDDRSLVPSPRARSSVDRATASGAVGRGSDSPRAHQPAGAWMRNRDGGRGFKFPILLAATYRPAMPGTCPSAGTASRPS